MSFRITKEQLSQNLTDMERVQLLEFLRELDRHSTRYDDYSDNELSEICSKANQVEFEILRRLGAEPPI